MPAKGWRKVEGQWQSPPGTQINFSATAQASEPPAEVKLVGRKTLEDGRTELTFERSIAAGSVVNRYNPYNRNIHDMMWTSDSVPFSNAMQIPTDPHDIMAMSSQLYFTDELIGTVIKLMVDFSMQALENQHEGEEEKKFYDEWAETANIEQVLKWIFLEYYRTGNVAIYRDIDKEGIPVAYTVLDPLQVHVVGSLMFGKERLAIKVNDELKRLVEDPFLARFAVDLPEPILKGVRSGDQYVILDDKRADRITFKRQPYERYAIPFTHNVFWPAMFKQKLRMMDLSTAEGIINQMIVVKVGSDEFPATPEQIETISNLLATPSKSYTLVWNHALEIEFKAPAGLDTLAADKYKQVDSDILAGLGVTRVLVDGQAANFSTAWVSIMSLVERLEWGRADVLNWLKREYKKIAQAKGFKKPANPKLNKLNLREDTFIKNVLMSLYDRGVISAQTLLEELNFNVDVEVDRRKKEKKYGELLLPPTLPFSQPQGGGSPSGRPDGKGRPSGAPDNKYSKRPIESTPRGRNGPKANLEKAQADLGQWLGYFHDMQGAWGDTMDKVVDAKAVQAQEERRQVVLEALATLILIMRDLSADWVGAAFDAIYATFHSSKPHFVYEKKAGLLRWHDDRITAFQNEMYQQVVSAIETGEDPVLVFDQFYNRFAMYPSEGVHVAERFASVAGMRATGVNQGRWVAQLDDRTCPVCSNLHNNVFNLDEDDIPLTHPQCRCRIEPV